MIDYLISVGSDLHSKLNGGIRTSMNDPSSFSILNVLFKEKINRIRKIELSRSYPHICPLGADRDT